jgi:hypothetical protein
MPGSQEQQLHAHEFSKAVVTPAMAALRSANSRPLKLYALLNGAETVTWALIGAAIEYFEPDPHPMNVGQQMEELSEMVIRDVGGETAFQAVLERFFFLKPPGATPVQAIPPSAALRARFQTMLMLQADLLAGAGSTLLSHLAFADDTSWETLLDRGQVHADEVVKALGAGDRSTTSAAYADYFTTLDHMAAFGELDEGDDPDGGRLHRLVGNLVGWRIKLSDPEISDRFGEISREVTGILLDECAKAGVGARVAHSALSSEVERLTARWKRFTAN